MGLIGVELHRIVVRRFLWGLLGLTTVVLVISAVFVFTDHGPKPDDDVTAQVELAQREQDGIEAECREQIDPGDENLCEIPDVVAEDIYLDDPRFRPEDIWEEQGRSDLFGTDFDVATTPDEAGDLVLDGPTRDEGEAGFLPGLLVAWAMVSGVLGAGFIGAEYKAGTIETALLWEPRRGRVLAAKFTAGALAAAAATLVVTVIMFAVLAPSLWLRGTTEGMNGAFWTGALAAIGRGAGIAGLAALAGMALATVTRSTAGGIATLYVGLAGAEIFVRGLGADMSRFLPGFNAVAVILDMDVDNFEFDSIFEASRVHGTGTAVAVTLITVALLTAVAVGAFLRRDIDE